MLVAQGGNALSSQSFAAIWAYAAQKIPTMRHGVVELTANTVLDATTHNQRILVVSQPMTLSANFTNMGSGFFCRIVNLSAGTVSMGTGIVSGSGTSTLPPGASADVLALTYSGGSLVWWDGVAPSVPTITVNAIASPAPNAAFPVTGGLFDEAPTALDYSTDGVNWTTASAPVIGTSTYSFQAAGLAAGTYTLSVRDHVATGIVGVSPAFSVVASSVSVTSVSASVAAGGTIAVGGGVSPAGAAVQVGLSASATVAPASFAAATVSGGGWSATIVAGDTAGTVYVWVELASNAAVLSVSGPVTITAVSAAIAYTINQPAVTSILAGSGSLALNGGITPAQNTATQVAFSTSNTAPPTTGWQAASMIDNYAVWAAYATAPASAGTYYVWVETASGFAPTVSAFTIAVT